MSRQANFTSIGLFVIVAFILGVGTFIFFGASKLHRNTAILVATFQGSTNGLRNGAKVKAYGVEVGQIKRIKLHRMEETDEVVIPVLMEIDLDHVSNLLGFSSLTDFNESTCLEALERDAHATLQLESFVTGMLYVEIIFDQTREGFILQDDRFKEFRAIPTLPTNMEVFLQSLETLAQNLGQTDFPGLVEETKQTVVDIRTRLNDLDLDGLLIRLTALLEEARGLLQSPELAAVLKEMSEVVHSVNGFSESLARNTEGTFDQLNRTLAQLELTTRQAQTWMDPANGFYQEVVDTLDQVSDAARSLRVLVQYLERNPNALLTGKPAQPTAP